METKYDKDVCEYAYNFMINLKKGDSFVLNNKHFEVKATGTFKSEFFYDEIFNTITIKSDKEQIKFYRMFGFHGNPKSSGKSSCNKQYNFLRDLEGCILVDLINQHNPLHELSTIFKKAISC